MPFSTIPNELILEIAGHLLTRDLSVFSSTSHALTELLTPILLNRATHDDLSRSIVVPRPASLRSILRSNTINANYTMAVPGSDILAWPLNHAAQYSTPEIVSILIQHGILVDEPESDHISNRATTLQCAVVSRSVEMVTLVLDAGANIDRTSDHIRCKPLSLACLGGDVDVVNLLIDRGALLGGDVLVAAAYGGCSPIIERILDLGVPVDSTYLSSSVTQPVSALQYVSMCSPATAHVTAEILLRRGADVNRGAEWNNSPLLFAVGTRNATLAGLLIEFGADTDQALGGKSLGTLVMELRVALTRQSSEST